jgi:small subunit ribosomal protein S17
MAERGMRKGQVGLVTSDKMDKTIVVEIEIVRRHPLYRKTIRRNKALKAHDEANAAKAGDRVRVVETRPLSKEKRWRLVEILERAR